VSIQAQPQDYASAIYDLALEAWTRQLGDVQKALREDVSLRTAVTDEDAAVGDRLSLLDRSTAGGLSEGVRKFLGTLLEAGHLDQLDAVLVEFERLVRRSPERKLAQVTSAVPLTSSEQEALRARLSDRFGADLEFQFEVDASLIGGVHLRVGDQVIDGSVAGKLAALRDRLAA
jgi:F-type H+-transporting ATPase subunit delta